MFALILPSSESGGYVFSTTSKFSSFGNPLNCFFILNDFDLIDVILFLLYFNIICNWYTAAIKERKLLRKLFILLHDIIPQSFQVCSKRFFFSIWVFPHKHSQFTGHHGKGEVISQTPLYHFNSLHRHLDISRAITAESSPLHIASKLWFPSAKSLITKLRALAKETKSLRLLFHLDKFIKT